MLQHRLAKPILLGCIILSLILLYKYSAQLSDASAHAAILKQYKTSYAADDTEGENISLDSSYEINVKLKSPANRTLGFETIQFINLAHRFDYADVMALNGALTELDIQTSRGVTPDDIKGKGISPQSNSYGEPQRACYRSHSNVWQKMVENNWQTMLVLESDATWDKNIKQIMQRFSAALDAHLKTSPSSRDNITEASEEDPYLYNNWDMLTFGLCNDGPQYLETDSLQYSDPDAPAYNFFGRELPGGERLVRRSHEPVCTTAYAISQSGARKMLLRGAIDYNRQVDLTIMDMVITEQILAYSTSPVIYAAWEYKQGIGAEQLNSNIDSRPDEDLSEFYDHWYEVHKNRNVWRLNYMYDGVLKNPIFNSLGSMIFGDIQPKPEDELTFDKDVYHKTEKSDEDNSEESSYEESTE